MYRERFVALFSRTLYCYTDSSHLMVETDIIDLKEAAVNGQQDKLKIVIKTAYPSSTKHVFRCANEKEFKGWMLALGPQPSSVSKQHTLARNKLYYSLDYKFDEESTPQQTGKQNPETDTFDAIVDGKLDGLHRHLNNLGIASQHINQRIAEQGRILDGLDPSLDATNDQMQNSLTKMKRT